MYEAAFEMLCPVWCPLVQGEFQQTRAVFRSWSHNEWEESMFLLEMKKVTGVLLLSSPLWRGVTEKTEPDSSQTFSFSKQLHGAQCALMSLLRIGVNLFILGCEWANFSTYAIWLEASSSDIHAARIGPRCCALHHGHAVRICQSSLCVGGCSILSVLRW